MRLFCFLVGKKSNALYAWDFFFYYVFGPLFVKGGAFVSSTNVAFESTLLKNHTQQTVDVHGLKGSGRGSYTAYLCIWVRVRYCRCNARSMVRWLMSGLNTEVHISIRDLAKFSWLTFGHLWPATGIHWSSTEVHVWTVNYLCLWVHGCRWKCAENLQNFCGSMIVG